MRPNGAAIRALRKAQQLSLRELARRIGRDRGYLSRLERGLIKDCAIEVIDAIAHTLGAPSAAITHKETSP